MADLWSMTQDELWDAEAARRYDSPGEGMFAPEVLAPTVSRLAELAAGGRALEFAIGTGRVAIALHEAGIAVDGIEYSRHMIARLREKVSESEIAVVHGDKCDCSDPDGHSGSRWRGPNWVRVSTREQNPEAQASELREAGAARVFVDHGESSRISERPQWIACLDYLREGDTLVIRALDRIAGAEQMAIEQIRDQGRRGSAAAEPD